MASRPYGEGDWFAIPLEDGSFARGVIARRGSRGVLLGYFFGPALSSPPDLESCSELSPNQSVLTGFFGDLGLRRQEWVVLGRLDSWNRNLWPLPVFERYDELGGRLFHVQYAENPLRELIKLTPAPLSTKGSLPRDSLMGWLFVQDVLSDLLTQ